MLADLAEDSRPVCKGPKLEHSYEPSQEESELREMHSLRDSSFQGQRSDGRQNFR